jgi:DNA-binding Xre family transcriptional regulator
MAHLPSRQHLPPRERDANFRRADPLRVYRQRRHFKAAPGPCGAVQLDVGRVCRERGLVVATGPHAGKPNLTALCRLTGISRVTAWNLLRRPGRPRAVTLDVLTRLCEGLGCEPGELFTYRPVALPNEPRESYRYGAQPTRPRAADPEREREEWAAAVGTPTGGLRELDLSPDAWDDFELAG